MWFIDKEITLGDAIWLLSEERKVIFVTGNLFTEPIRFEPFTGLSTTLTELFTLLFSAGLKV